MEKKSFRIAAVQASPVFMDRDATVAKACSLIKEIGDNGAKLAVFPEVFIPTYPDWIWLVPAGQIVLNQQLYGELVDQAVTIPGPTTDRLGQAAKEAGIYLSIGVNERNESASRGSLFNTNILIGPDGNIIGYHQKLVPTVSERTVWAYGDPSTLDVYDTNIGKIGGLICHENYMPLVRYSLYGRGIELYVAPTYDEGEAWQSTLRHIGREGRVYVVGCCMVLKKRDILERMPQLEPYYKEAGDWINTGNSMIADPEGNILAGPLSKEEGILYADVDLNNIRGTKWNLDVAGHYARPDAFQLTIRTAPNPIVRVDSEFSGLPVDRVEENKPINVGSGEGGSSS
ncbi:MAG: carbon-nitrogen hydrolase family protein [Deltaproteobacteria bacterium]|nr:carbon-nitrogen hydrolase family protein [Deltaproteobacteria bacterium]